MDIEIMTNFNEKLEMNVKTHTEPTRYITSIIRIKTQYKYTNEIKECKYTFDKIENKLYLYNDIKLRRLNKKESNELNNQLHSLIKDKHILWCELPLSKTKTLMVYPQP